MMRALPQDVLVLVLRHVDQAERFSSCALVSTAWAKAAVIASDAVSICTRDLEPFIPWLQHHGSHVTRFDCAYDGAHSDRGVLSTLPCSNLLELTLEDWHILLGPMEGNSGILHAVTGLTKLHLDLKNQENLVGDLLSLTALHALPALQHFNLSVRECLDHCGPDVSDELPSSVLSGLRSLVRLELSGEVGLESLQPLSCLTKLQHLNLNVNGVVGDNKEAVQLGQQPFKQLQALTHLSINILECKLVSTSTSPAFSGCTGLRDLYLCSAMLDASAFRGLTGLHVLELWVADVVEHAAVGGVAALLRHIASMQQLQCLMLGKGSPADTVALRDADAAACGVITGSANLKSFDLTGVWLPRAAWAYIFPPGRRLLQLQKFELCFGGSVGVDIAGFDYSAFEQLVDCCPAIQRLSFQIILLFRLDVCLAPLLQLQQLAHLECPFVADHFASVGVLASLSSLTTLRLRASGHLSDVGLLQLTALTGLQELTVSLQDSRYTGRLAILEGSNCLTTTVSMLVRLQGCCLFSCALVCECTVTVTCTVRLPVKQPALHSCHPASAVLLQSCMACSGPNMICATCLVSADVQLCTTCGCPSASVLAGNARPQA
jgi:hypothetical protein